MQNPKVDDLLVIPIDHTSPNKDELEKIAKLYSQILVPEMDLVDYPKDELLAKASQLEGLISNISAVETADESSGRLKELVQKDVDLYKYFANTSRQTLEAVLDSDFSDICDDMISLNTANNKASPMPSFQSDAFEIASAIESPSLRHTASRQSVLTGVTNPIIRSLQDDPLSSIPPSPSGVFQWTVLRSISSHLKSMVSIHGDITSFDVSFALAFGTKSSVILVYSLEQKFLGPIGSAEQCYGSVSCLKFGEHKAHLIAGYSNGNH